MVVSREGELWTLWTATERRDRVTSRTGNEATIGDTLVTSVVLLLPLVLLLWTDNGVRLDKA